MSSPVRVLFFQDLIISLSCKDTILWHNSKEILEIFTEEIRYVSHSANRGVRIAQALCNADVCCILAFLAVPLQLTAEIFLNFILVLTKSIVIP